MPNLALVGVGKWGINWARTLARLPRTQFRYCCDLAENRLQPIKDQFPSVVTTTNFQDLLNDKSLDGLVLATTAPTHYKLAMQALKANKHLLVEKPLTLSSQEALELVQVAERHNCVLMVGHLLEYHPATLHIKQMIENGELGDIYYLYSQRLNLGTIRRDENAWWSLAPHDISVACRLYGEEPCSVQCRGQNVVQPNVADVVFATLTFRSGRIAHIHVSWLDPHKTRKLTVVGSRRMVAFDDTLPGYQLMIHDKSFIRRDQFETYAEWISMRQGDIVLPNIQAAEPLLQEARHFVDCIETGQRPVSDGRSGMRVVSILEHGELSLKRSGAVVEIPTLGEGQQTIARAA
jgi:predicted dehydrogenase